MNEVYLLSSTLVAAGLYVVYLHGVIRKYAEWTNMARTALVASYVALTSAVEEEEEDEEADDLTTD